MRSWESKDYKYSKLGKMDLIWWINKIKHTYLFSWLERYCEIIIRKRDRSSSCSSMYCQLNSFYDCTETWPVDMQLHSIIFDWIPVCYMCSECHLVYVLWTVSSTWSGTKVKLHCSCVEFHGKHNTINSSAEFDTVVNGPN